MELIPDTDPRLHKESEPLNPRNPGFNLDRTIIDMFVLMKEKAGVGLAAPQVGINKRLFILEYQGERFICINPKVLKVSKDLQEGQEGCLSYPGLYGNVTRPMVVRTQFMLPSGLVRKHTFRGLLARAFLHELDHLNGITLPELIEDSEITGDGRRQHSGQTL